MKKNTLFAGIFVVLAAAFLSLPNAFSINKADARTISAAQFMQNSAPTSHLKNYAIQTSVPQQSFTVSSSLMQSLLADAGVLTLSDFPIAPEQTGTLVLAQVHSPIDAKTNIWTHTKDGLQPYTPPPAHIYRGFIQNEPDSRVFFNVLGGDVLASIERADGSRYVFSPANASTEDAREHVVISSNDINALEEHPIFNCLTNENIPFLSNTTGKKYASVEEILSNTQLLQFELAVETDSQFYTAMGGNPEKIAAYITALYAMVSSIYEDEVNVTFHIPFFLIWDNAAGDNGADPYSATDIEPMLQQFTDFWTSNRGDITRSIAQLVTSLNPGKGGVAGIGNISSLCSNDEGYSIVGLYTTKASNLNIYPTLNYTWDVNVIAHELGHNFSAPHTHNCFWKTYGGTYPGPLDSCTSSDTAYKKQGLYSDACNRGKPVSNPGTIMSYCHLINKNHDVQLTFSPRVAARLREGAEKAQCMKAPESPVVILQNPLGHQTVKGQTSVDVRWVYSQVSRVTLQYSIDKGEHWRTIVEDTDATVRKCLWIAPAEKVPEALVRIFDVSNPLVGDTSITFFQIALPQGVDDNSQFSSSSILISPNPVEGTAELSYKTPSFVRQMRMSIRDLTGKTVLDLPTVRNIAEGEHRISLDFSSLTQGVYLLVMDNGVTPVVREITVLR